MPPIEIPVLGHRIGRRDVWACRIDMRARCAHCAGWKAIGDSGGQPVVEKLGSQHCRQLGLPGHVNDCLSYQHTQWANPENSEFLKDFVEWRARYLDLARLVAFCLTGNPRTDPYSLEGQDMVITLAYRPLDRDVSCLRMRLPVKDISVGPSLGLLRRNSLGQRMNRSEGAAGRYWIKLVVQCAPDAAEGFHVPQDHMNHPTFWPVEIDVLHLMVFRRRLDAHQRTMWPKLMLKIDPSHHFSTNHLLRRFSTPAFCSPSYSPLHSLAPGLSNKAPDPEIKYLVSALPCGLQVQKGMPPYPFPVLGRSITRRDVWASRIDMRPRCDSCEGWKTTGDPTTGDPSRAPKVKKLGLCPNCLITTYCSKKCQENAMLTHVHHCMSYQRQVKLNPACYDFMKDFLEWRTRYIDLVRLVCFCLTGDPRTDPYSIRGQDIVITMSYRSLDRPVSSLRMRLPVHDISVRPSFGLLRRQKDRARGGEFRKDLPAKMAGRYFIKFIVRCKPGDAATSLVPQDHVNEPVFWMVEIERAHLEVVKRDINAHQQTMWPKLMLKMCGRYKDMPTD
ncbi:hypothetical protein EIP91_011328 [Steccherinum ochraceum]|uniref:MYND-type domain-containing protein n=1 Tax=Steccherinum ochraceum TaxID=92696 RepID=A0A4R0R506_9APHY|nr:hypothetical protein EIP91_011328 [Steccherinum ochraceum]